VQHLILDVEGEFYTLREKFDYVLAARRARRCSPTRARPQARAPAARTRRLGVLDIYD
jgi:hypothetical protein